eukprot:578506-Rhodomonas_salina.5
MLRRLWLATDAAGPGHWQASAARRHFQEHPGHHHRLDPFQPRHWQVARAWRAREQLEGLGVAHDPRRDCGLTCAVGLRLPRRPEPRVSVL